jgi:hypothetical protein
MCCSFFIAAGEKRGMRRGERKRRKRDERIEGERGEEDRGR